MVKAISHSITIRAYVYVCVRVCVPVCVCVLRILTIYSLRMFKYRHISLTVVIAMHVSPVHSCMIPHWHFVSAAQEPSNLQFWACLEPQKNMCFLMLLRMSSSGFQGCHGWSLIIFRGAGPGYKHCVFKPLPPIALQLTFLTIACQPNRLLNCFDLSQYFLIFQSSFHGSIWPFKTTSG